MRILITSDHAGFELKKTLFKFLKEKNFEVTDCGPDKFNPDDDYPDFVIPVAKAVGNDPEQSRGIIIGGSGQGEAMCANRFPRVRAVVFYGNPARLNLGSEERFNLAVLSRQHNNANILAIGGRFVSEEEAKKAVLLWLETPFSGEMRHIHRLEKIDKLAP